LTVSPKLPDKLRTTRTIYSQNGFMQRACATTDFRFNEIFSFVISWTLAGAIFHHFHQIWYNGSWGNFEDWVRGFLYSAQCKWRNGENNRSLTLTLSLTIPLTLILTLTLTLTLLLTLNLTLKLTVKALRHLHCAEYREPEFVCDRKRKYFARMRAVEFPCLRHFQ